MLKLTDAMIESVRRIASELRPSILDDLGLVEAIEWLGQQFQERTGIVCRCERHGDSVKLNAEQSTAAFRIFQEALTNILRHARPTRVDVSIRQGDGCFTLTIRDNGGGFIESSKQDRLSLGLLGMRERSLAVGGTLHIESAEGAGTTITLRIPTGGAQR
jgi:signal transduction histidine kinase